jgi:D-alanyl-lipoteichoic acid acyltransferase DltB (MBOAT superfamily)
MVWKALSPKQEVYVIIATFIIINFAFAWFSRKLPDDGITLHPVKYVFLVIICALFLGVLIIRYRD